MKKMRKSLILAAVLISITAAFLACGGKTYTVNFMVDDEVYHTISTAGKEEITLPEDPEKENYTFEGWYFDKDAWEEPFTAQSFLEKALTGDVTVYAKFSFNKYTVIFDGNGGTLVSGQATQEVEHGSAATAPVFEKAGYTLSWNKSFDEITEDTTVTAVWTLVTYNITYNNTNNATNSNPATYTVESNDINLTNLTGRTGYDFVKWQDESGNTVTKIAKGSTGNITLTAVWQPTSYTITYNTVYFVNNPNPTTYTIESNDINLAGLPNWNGYSFVKWQDESGNTVTKIAKGSTGNITLTAVWKTVDYAITYNDTFGATNPNPATYTIEDEVTLAALTGREGYTFVEWQDAQGNTVNKIAEGTTGNITLTAIWQINQYTIVFDSNEGSVCDSITADFGAEITLPEPVRDGYEFGGWFTDNESFKNEFTLTTMPAYNITLYAKWVTIIEYTITFESNGGTAVDSITRHGGDAISAPANPTKEGYTFEGWFTDDGTFNEPFEWTTMPEENITLYAKWTINQYTITFESNGGTEVASITQDYGTVVTKPQDPTKVGHTFVGWFTDDGTFENEFVFTTMPAGNITLYAKWEAEKYTVIFLANGGSLVFGETVQIVEYGKAAVAPVFEKEGYTLSWDKSFDYVTGDMTVNAVWTIAQFTISFDTKGGTEIAAITQDYGTEITAPEAPEREGYEFAGWFTDDGTFNNEFEWTTMPAQNITLYAKWNVIQYTITFNPNEGSAVDAITQDYGTALTLPTPVRAGYEFAGWFYDNETFEQKFTATTMPAQNVILYAKWNVAKFTLNVYGGTVSGKSGQPDGDKLVYSIEFNTEVTVVANPAPEGKIFVGWDYQTVGSRIDTEPQFTFIMPDMTVTIWAVFEDIAPESIEMTSTPYRIVYSDAMTFEIDGFEANAVYNDGYKVKVEATRFTVVNDVLTAGQTSVSVWCEVAGVTLFFDIPITVVPAAQYTDGTIVSIKAEGTVYLTEGQPTSQAQPVIRATYDNGNRLVLPASAIEVTANTENASVNKKCILSVFLKNNPAIFTKTAAIVRSAVEAELTALTGTTPAEVQEYSYDGNTYTEAGNVTAVTAADGATLTFTLSSSTILKPDVFIRVAVNAEGSINLAEVMTMTINGREVYIPSTTVVTAPENANGKLVFYNIALPAIVLNISESNTLVLAFEGSNASKLVIDKLIFDIGYKGEFYASTEEYIVANSQSGQNAPFDYTIVKAFGSIAGKAYGHAICSDGTYLYITATSYSKDLRALRVQKYDPVTNTQVAASAETEVAANEACAGITYYDSKIIIYFNDGRRMYVNVNDFVDGCVFQEYTGFDFESLETAILKDVYFNASAQRFAVFSGNNIYLFGTDKKLIKSFAVPSVSGVGSAKRMTGSADYIYISYTKDGQYSPVVQIFDWNGNSLGGLTIPISSDFITNNGAPDLTKTNIQGMAVIKGDVYAILLKFGQTNGGDSTAYVKISMPEISEELEPELTLKEYLNACEDAEVNPDFIVEPATGMLGGINGTSGYAMGGVSDGKFLYVANNKNSNTSTAITKVNAFTYQKVATSATFAVDSSVSNGDNSRLFIKDGVLYCVAGTVFSVPLNAFAEGCQVNLDTAMTALLSNNGARVLKSAYWNDSERLYAVMDNSGKLYVLDEEGNAITSTINLLYPTAGYIASSICGDADYIYVSYKLNGQNIIPVDIYTWDGAKVKTLDIPGINFGTTSFNIQAIFMHNGTLHASVCTWAGNSIFYDWVLKPDLGVFAIGE